MMGIGSNANFSKIQDQDNQESFRYLTELGADSMAARFDQHPKSISIARILEQQRPSDFPVDGKPDKYDEGRISPFETSIWQTKATIIRVQLKDHGEIWMVLEGKPGEKVIAVSPDLLQEDPLSRVSKYAKEIESTHTMLMSKLNPTESLTECNYSVNLISLGFFGPALKGNWIQNGASLQPLLKVTFTAG